MIIPNPTVCVWSAFLFIGYFYLRLAPCQLILSDNDGDQPLLLSQNIGDAGFYQLDSSPQPEYTALAGDNYGPNDVSDYYHDRLRDTPQATRDDNSEIISRLPGELLASRLKHQQQQYQQAQADEPVVAPLELTGETGAVPAVWLRRQSVEPQQKRRTPALGYNRYVYHQDVNSHLPASTADDSELSKPVNDPEEFEAQLGRLTDMLNHNMANTRGRHEFLVALLNMSRAPSSDAASAGSSSREPSSISSLSSMSQLEIERLVSQLDKWLEELTSGDESGQAERRQTADDGEDNGVQASLARYSGSEYIDHPLALAGHQYVQGGAGEGRQLLGPEGTYENVQVVKTDTGIPSYCDPPNPCPIGYTAKDGCLEEFVNSASFSREYQAQQKCTCDNEHSLFNCAAPSSTSQQQQRQSDRNSAQLSAGSTVGSSLSLASDNDATDNERASSSFDLASKFETLARNLQSHLGNLAFVQKLIGKQKHQEERLGEQSDQLQHRFVIGADDPNSNYLVRSARKLSSLDMHHKTSLD